MVFAISERPSVTLRRKHKDDIIRDGVTRLTVELVALLGANIWEFAPARVNIHI